MGFEISCDEDAPVPRRTRLTLTCDAASEFFCRGFQHFDEGNYVDNLALAKRTGWHESGGVNFICPECSKSG